MKQLALMLTFFAIVLSSAAVRAADSQGEFNAAKEKLRARFEARYPAVSAAKTSGKIGETSDGYIEAVKPAFRDDKDLAKLIDDENADRKALYQLLADHEGAAFETVAERAAQRNFQHARAGEFLKSDGTWRQK